jgi:two-component system response regulator DegU
MSAKSVLKAPVVRVLIADDHVTYRKNLRMVLELDDSIQVVADTGEWQELEQAVDRHWPDVVLMDISMPTRYGNRDGIKATRHLLRSHPHTAVLMLSMFDEVKYCKSAQMAGARGYYLKETDSKELVKAIRTVAKGGLISCDHISCDVAPSSHYGLGFDLASTRTDSYLGFRTTYRSE